LLPRHEWLQLPAARVGDAESQYVLEIVFDRVPTRGPDRQREIQRILIDVSYSSGYVKELLFDAGHLDGVIYSELIGGLRRIGE